MIEVLSALGRHDSHVATLLEGSAQVRIARRCADLADLLAAAASGLGDVALVGEDLRGLQLSVVQRLRESGVAVVGVVDGSGEHGERRLRQLGVGTVVTAGDSLADVEAALEPQGGAAYPLGGELPAWPEQAGSSSPDDPDDRAGLPERGTVLAVWGPTGAPGRTTVAVNLASELAALGVRTLLVDADTYGASVAQTLSVLDEAPGLAAATRAAEHGTLDALVLAGLAPEVSRGLRVLTGIPRADRWTEIRAAALERILEVSRSLAQLVVVDCGFCLEDDEELSYDTRAPRRNEATLTTLEVADSLVVVGGCDPVALQRLVRGVQELGTARSPQPVVVINRVRSGAVGPRPEEAVREVLSRFAGIEEPAFVPDDPGGLDLAMRAGRALHECAPASPARRAIQELARRLGGDLVGPTRAAIAQAGSRRAGWRRVRV